MQDVNWAAVYDAVASRLLGSLFNTMACVVPTPLPNPNTSVMPSVALYGRPVAHCMIGVKVMPHFRLTSPLTVIRCLSSAGVGPRSWGANQFRRSVGPFPKAAELPLYARAFEST